MNNATYFTHPNADWQRKYETLRAAFVERLPDKLIAERFGYSPGYVSQLRFKFRHGQIDFSEPTAEGKTSRRKVDRDTRETIILCRQKNLSAGEILEVLLQQGIELSIRTVERVLAEEGFSKLPRRTQLRIGKTIKGGEIPEKAGSISEVFSHKCALISDTA